MKFSCLKDNITKLTGIFNTMSVKNVNLPILRNIYIQAQEQGINLITTNLEIAIKVMIRGKVEETGEFTIPIKLFTDYISLIDGEKIDFELKNNELRISSGNSETNIKGIGANDYPVIPVIDEKMNFKISNSSFIEAINKTLFAISENDLRPEISGMLFKFNKTHLIIAGTDSFRLAEKTIKLNEQGTDFQVIIPLQTAIELQRILNINENQENNEQVEIIIGENQILFKKGNIELISRIIEGSYPNYTQIIPKSFLTTVLIDRNQLIKNIKTSSLFSRSGIYDINLVFDKDKIIINSNDINTGAFNSSLKAEITGNTNKIVLNYKFLMEGLGAITSKIAVLKVIDDSNPMMIENFEAEKNESSEKENTYVYLIMPIRQ